MNLSGGLGNAPAAVFLFEYRRLEGRAHQGRSGNDLCERRATNVCMVR